MNYVVAVSGGVDSVVLLDMLARQTKHNLVVAHFDHGIRATSDADARFVHELSKRYRLPFETRREELGANAGEAIARERRYAFLHEIADKYNAVIVTAHHEDDVLETVAINCFRGTGWRGLSVMDTQKIKRPLLGQKKAMLYEYALRHNLEYVEDETNREQKYMRNRLRRYLCNLSDDSKLRILQLRNHQIVLKTSLAREVQRFMEHERYFFIMIDEIVAIEILRSMTNGLLTRPQLKSVLMAIKVAKPGTSLEPGGGCRISFSERKFTIAID